MSESIKKLIKKALKDINFNTNKIYIIGKGPSMNNVDKSIITDGLIINLNDSEKILPGHFTLLHSNWAIESVKRNGFKSKVYISDSVLECNSISVPYVPVSFEQVQNATVDLINKDFSLSDFLFLGAIKLARIISEIQNKKYEVCFLGFDFNFSLEKTIKDYSNYNSEFSSILLQTQEQIFTVIKYHTDYYLEDIDIIHVGNKPYSDVSVEDFNNKSSFVDRTKKTNSELYADLIEKINDNIPIIVAELTNNHIGDEHRLRKMIKLCKQHGADAIKVQKRDVDTFYTPSELQSYYKSPFGNTLRDYRINVELNDHLFKVLIDECTKNQIFWFTSVLDKNSYEYMLQYDTPLIKLPSTISNHRNYLSHVANTFKGDIVVSTGFTDSEYEEFVLNTFKNKDRLYLLQCTSSYPAPPDSCNVGVVNHYSQIRASHKNIIPGYSSHDVGSLASQIAIGAGALMIEKHVKLGNLDWVHFDGVALDVSNNEFSTFVKDLKQAIVIKGESLKKIHKKEHHKYKVNKAHN